MSCNKLHKNLTGTDIHIPYTWSYADSTTREGASGFDSSDIGKFARQLDDNSIWMLTATTPTWISISGGDCSCVSEELPCLQLIRTSNYTFTSSFVDVTFDQTDIENEPSVIEHDNINTDRILIKEDGIYKVCYGFSNMPTDYATFQSRVRINDTTVVLGSLIEVKDDNDMDGIACTCMVELEAGDYLTFQLGFINGSPGASVAKDIHFLSFKLQGSKGDKGDAGEAGADGDITWEGAWASQDYTANQAVEYNGSSYVCHTNTTSSQVPTDINYWDILASKGEQGSSGTSNDAVQARRSTIYTLTTTYTDITFDQTDVETDDTILEHDDTNTDRIKVKETGTYFISYSFDIEASTNMYDTTYAYGQVRKNDTSVIPGSSSRITTLKDDSLDGNPAMNNNLDRSFLANLTSNDYISLQLKYSNDVADTVTNGILLIYKLV